MYPAAGGSAPSGGHEDMGEAGGDTTGRSQQEAGDVTALVAAAADMSPDTNRHRTEGEAARAVCHALQLHFRIIQAGLLASRKRYVGC